MKINLRKASQLERDVQTLISDLQDQLEGRIELDEFSKPLDEIERALSTFRAGLRFWGGKAGPVLGLFSFSQPNEGVSL